MPFDISVVPSMGSTATSHSGPSPLPTSSPLYSMGASSFSPSPITTTPRMDTVPINWRIASTAAWSPPFLSPLPTHRPAAIAAASVTRTSSIARLRSGASPRCVARADWLVVMVPPDGVVRARRFLYLTEWTLATPTPCHRDHATSKATRLPLARILRGFATVLIVFGSLLGALLHGSQRRIDALAGAFEVSLAQSRQSFAALPQRQRLLQGQAAGLQVLHDFDQLVPGLLVAETGQFVVCVVVRFAHGVVHARLGIHSSVRRRTGLAAHTTAPIAARPYATNVRPPSPLGFSRDRSHGPIGEPYPQWGPLGHLGNRPEHAELTFRVEVLHDRVATLQRGRRSQCRQPSTSRRERGLFVAD